MTQPMSTDTDSRLLCPHCGAIYVHLDAVYVAARQESREFNEISIDAITGDVATQLPAGSVPTGDAVGDGDRHRIALPAWCECCGSRFAFVFTQHKGATYLEIAEV